jgi:hypothetical protein
MFTRLTPTTAPLYLLSANLLFGIGFGLVNPPITQAAVSGMPSAQAGVAAAVASTSRQVGSTLGVAVVGAVVAGGVAGAIGPGFASASHAAWWIITGLGVAVLALGLASTSSWAAATARASAERFGSDAVAAPAGVR